MAKKRKIREKLLQAPGMMTDSMQTMTNWTSGAFNASIMDSAESIKGATRPKPSTGRTAHSMPISPPKTSQNPNRSGGNQR